LIGAGAGQGRGSNQRFFYEEVEMSTRDLRNLREFRDLRDFIREVNTHLLDNVLPYYVWNNRRYVMIIRSPPSRFWIIVLLLPPVRAVIEGIRRLLSKNRRYYAPEPDW
jgi:hypothetical protein